PGKWVNVRSPPFVVPPSGGREFVVPPSGGPSHSAPSRVKIRNGNATPVGNCGLTGIFVNLIVWDRTVKQLLGFPSAPKSKSKTCRLFCSPNGGFPFDKLI